MRRTSSRPARCNRCSSIRPRSRSSYILQHILREHLDAALVGVSRWRCLPGVEDPARLVRLPAEHPHKDGRSVVEGKSVSVRVEYGVGRDLSKKRTHHYTYNIRTS